MMFDGPTSVLSFRDFHFGRNLYFSFFDIFKNSFFLAVSSNSVYAI